MRQAGSRCAQVALRTSPRARPTPAGSSRDQRQAVFTDGFKRTALPCPTSGAYDAATRHCTAPASGEELEELVLLVPPALAVVVPDIVRRLFADARVLDHNASVGHEVREFRPLLFGE